MKRQKSPGETHTHEEQRFSMGLWLSCASETDRLTPTGKTSVSTACPMLSERLELNGWRCEADRPVLEQMEFCSASGVDFVIVIDTEEGGFDTRLVEIEKPGGTITWLTPIEKKLF